MRSINALSMLATLALLAAPVAAQDLSQESERQLLERVSTKKNGTDKAVFEELGGRKTRAAFQALKSSLSELTGNPGLKSATEAFRHFKGVPELERMAISTLYSVSQEAHLTRQRLSAAALSRFSNQAEDELTRIVDKSSDPVTRANALDGLLPALSSNATRKDLNFTLDAMRVTVTLTRAECLKGLKAFMENGPAKNFKDALSNKDLSASVRRMVLEAIASIPSDEYSAHLMDALKSKEDEIAHGALLALADRGWMDYGRELRKLIKHSDQAIRRDALVIQAELLGSDPIFFDRLLDQADSDDHVERSAAAISLGTIRTQESMLALHRLLKDPDSGVKFQALQAVLAARKEASVPALIEVLQIERGLLMPTVSRNLQLLTAQDFGSSHSRWSAWWRDNSEKFTCPSIETAQAALAARAEIKASSKTRASFFGIRILSDRICFVIDNSASMLSKTKSGKTRLQAMQDQLIQTLRALPESTLANLTFFAARIERWKDKLHSLNKGNRESAVEMIRAIGTGGATITYEGLLAGLEDPRVDTIYLLTDGHPAGGAMPRTSDILREIARRNTVRHVVINCISIGQDSTFLRKLAEQNNGTYTRVD